MGPGTEAQPRDLSPRALCGSHVERGAAHGTHQGAAHKELGQAEV